MQAEVEHMKIILLSIILFITTSVIGQTNDSKCDSVSISVLFKSGDFSIDEHADSILLSLVLDLELEDIDRVLLVGHTDKHGSKEYNRKLSKQRVESVEHFLLDYVDIEIGTDYYGETKLIAFDTTEQSDQLNRRVEIKYYTNCDTDESEDNETSIIYKADQNCHIDSATTNSHYNSNLFGTKHSTIVVIDWTRSMYAYGLQLLDWFQKNNAEASFDEILVFNDGDGKPTSEKRNGFTGGIYSSKLTNIDSVVNLMEMVAKKGTGGDYPENYIEALLTAQRSNSNLDTLILIADNRACIRDYKLLDSLKLPVIVILNEIDEDDRIVNYQYVNLVAENGGRIVFMNNSINDIRFKDDQGHKPIYFPDTLIELPKFRGDLDEAYEKIAAMKEALLKTSIPPILQVNGQELPTCYNKMIPSTDVKIGCASCRIYDYKIRTHTTFEVQYTFRQKIQIRWRNRLRARFKVIDYKWRKIKCANCKKIEDNKEKKICTKERNKCQKDKRDCKKNKIKAKKSLKRYKKKRRKEAWKSFKNFFKVKKSSSTSKSSTKKERTQ